MSKRIVGYVVRSGKKRGGGEYLGRWGASANWQIKRRFSDDPDDDWACLCASANDRATAEELAEDYGGRIVRLVAVDREKRSPCHVCGPENAAKYCQRCVNGITGERAYEREKAGRDAARAEGAKEATARIVAWLRGDFKYNRNAHGFADAIERGDHEHPNGPPPCTVVEHEGRKP